MWCYRMPLTCFQSYIIKGIPSVKWVWVKQNPYPITVLVNINDLGESLQLNKSLIYTDNITLFFKCTRDELQQRMSEELISLHIWLLLTISCSTQVISLLHRKAILPTVISLNNFVYRKSLSVNLFEFNVDISYSRSPHVFNLLKYLHHTSARWELLAPLDLKN